MAIEFIFRPLVKWPRKQTPERNRQACPFVRPMKGGQGGGPTRVGQTYKELEYELERMLVSGPVYIEAGFQASEIRQDGLPYANARRPDFPGVAVYVVSRGRPLVFACDRCHRWEDNLRAITLTLERLRLADLYGVTSSGEQYSGFAALPPPAPAGGFGTVDEALAWCCQKLGLVQLESHLVILTERDAWSAAYRELAKRFHPDTVQGRGYEAEWKSLQAAKVLIDGHHTARGAA